MAEKSPFEASPHQRLQYVDVARGVAMLAVLLGHMGVRDINRVVYTFDLPLFFLVTGYFTSDRGSLRSFVRKRFGSLIMPYVVTVVAVTLGATIKNALHGPDPWQSVLAEWGFSALYGSGNATEIPWLGLRARSIGALWFLLATFWGVLILRLLLNAKPAVRAMVVAVVLCVSVELSRMRIWLPWSLQMGGCGLLWMYVGWLWRRLGEGRKPANKYLRVAVTLACAAVWAMFIWNFTSFYLVSCDIGRGAIDVVGSLCACYVVIRACDVACEKAPNATSPLAWFGRYSLLALCVHEFEMYVFPWYSIKTMLSSHGCSDYAVLAVCIALRIVLVVGATFALTRSKRTMRLFGYGMRPGS